MARVVPALVLLFLMLNICAGSNHCQPNCDLIACDYPEGCENGLIIPECQCCPVCAEDSSEESLEDDLSSEGRKLVKRSPFRRRAGKAKKVARQYKHLSSGSNIPQEVLAKLRAIQRMNMNRGD